MEMEQLLLEFLTKDQVLTDANDLVQYGKDWARDFEAAPSLIVFPSSYEEVQKVIRACAEHSMAIVPSGGRTGLSGGATATDGEVVLSLERLNKIIETNPVDSTLRCEAGVITARIQEAAADHGLYFPVDLASAGSSQIGGNLATNAGGIHVIRYGSTREWVQGLKVVTGRGDLLELNGNLVKNQTGYDLRSLLVGSEGTLGVIVEVTLKLAPRPKEFHRALFAAEEMSTVLEILGKVRPQFPRLSAFEFFTRLSLEYVLKHHELRDPFSAPHPYYGLLEIEDMSQQEIERFEQFLMDEIENERISDVVIAQNSQQSNELFALRELIGETASTHYVVHKNDLSVPVRHISAFLDSLAKVSKAVYPECDVLLFGHVGDGNVHVNILKPDSLDRDQFFSLCHARDEELYKIVAKFNGSISAEHGVGLLKRDFLHHSRSPEELAIMRGIKQTFDPHGILNPGKIFVAQ